MKKMIRLCGFIFSFWVLTSGCTKEEAPLPDNVATFESSGLGIADNSENLDVAVKLSRPVEESVNLAIQIVSTDVVYAQDFTTEPAATNNSITINIPVGSNSASFRVLKVPGALFDGDEKIKFTIQSASGAVVIGSAPEITVSFSEIISAADSLLVDGGGANYGNKVFFDLSANRQTPVERTKWDLGFYSGSDFRVILNSSTGMMARVLDETDLNAVTAADTAAFDQEMSFSAFSKEALPFIDYPDGDLSKTAIASISATDAENKVYIIFRGTGIGSPAPSRGWKKIRILRNSSGGYTLQHADIAATSFQETAVAKNETHFFNYTSFENGGVSVEPEKNKWDIAWTYFSNVTAYDGGEIPYTYQDFVIQNRNVETAKVLTSAFSYESFSEAQLAGLTFNRAQNGIGSDWRSGGGPGVSPYIRTDRFYVVKDGDGNIYKVRFTALTKDGERGKPAFEYALVKKKA